MNMNQGLPLLPIHMAIAPTSPTLHKTFDLFLPPIPNPLTPQSKLKLYRNDCHRAHS